MSKDKKLRLTFRADELAVPEICTGEVPEAEELAEADSEELEEIQYDTVAIPEIHIGHKSNKQ